jgi:hypothetical protein
MLRRRQFLAYAASAASAQPPGNANELAQLYVKLVLAAGGHDPNYVDAYYGPPEWKEEAARQQLPLPQIRRQAEELAARFAALPAAADELTALRHRYLVVQTRSLAKRVEILEGKRFSFDEESQALYDAVAPVIPEQEFQFTLDRLEKLIPGQAPLVERYESWQRQFFVPPVKLEEVFLAAVSEARRRTKQHIQLPAGESFDVEFVKNQPWNAYNWYKGKSRSLIQVNTDLPVEIGRVPALAAHEGYPGHHVYNALLEQYLVVKRGWVEYSVYPLYSPQSLIAEGTAEYGVDLAFPPAERVAFYEKMLFPRAGLDPAKAAAYQAVELLVDKLSHVRTQAARSYLDGKNTREECLAKLSRYALQRPERAAKSVDFLEKNRAYVINYDVGQDLVRSFMEKRGAPLSNPKKAWREFEALLSSPRLPSGLV